MLNLTSGTQPLTTYNNTKNGGKRKKPIIINYGDLCGTMAVFGKSWNKPFGGIDLITKLSLGQEIVSAYKNKANSSRINILSKIIV